MLERMHVLAVEYVSSLLEDALRKAETKYRLEDPNIGPFDKGQRWIIGF
jgi:hypothetical protein